MRRPPPAPTRARLPAWTARDSVLAEWRGVDVTPLEVAARRGERRVGELIPELVKKLGLPKRHAEAQVLKSWNRLVDPSVTAHAQPAGLRRGTLFVKVDSSVWLSEIVRYRREEILERLQHCFGRDLVTRISFRLG